MNSETKHFIFLAVSLSITIAIMTLFFELYQKYRESYEIIEEQTLSMSQELKNYYITKYNGRNISGSDAVNYVKTIYNKVVVMYRSQTINDGNIDYLRDESNAVYIDPTGLYNVDIKMVNGIPRTVTLIER